MNIFASSPCPVESAMALDDLRVNKMILESAQIICTTLDSWGVKNLPYKPTHHHHPVVLWAGRAPQNLSWLIKHHWALASIFRNSRGKEHLSFLVVGNRFPHFITNINPSEFEKCTGFYSYVEDVHESYRQCLRTKWCNDKREPTWIGRGKPSWA